MACETDSNSGGVIKMHLPSTMFDGVVDLLRNEKPMSIYFSAGSGFLASSKEPVGEGE